MMAMTYEEAQEFMREEPATARAREAWIKAERQALAEQPEVLATKQSAQLGYEVVCGCGHKHLVVLTVDVRASLDAGDDAHRLIGVKLVDGADAGLGSKGEDGQAGLQPQDAVFHVVHSSLHRVGCTTDGRGRAGVGEGDNSPRPRAIVRAVRAIWRWLAALDDHWIGDAIGVICLFGLGYSALVAGHIFGWQ